MSNYHNDGVIISQDVIENSIAKKAKRKQTLAQLPVYRAVGNLKYVIVGITKNAPRSLRRFIDRLQDNSDNLATAIGYADVSYSVEDRRWYINSAIVLVNNLKQDFVILEKNEVISKDLLNKATNHIRGIMNQLIAWRGSLPNSGVPALSPAPKGGVA